MGALGVHLLIFLLLLLVFSSFNFCHFGYNVSYVFLFWLLLYGDSAFPGLGYFISYVKEIFRYYLFTYFHGPFLSLFFWDNYNANISGVDVVPEAPSNCPHFIFFCSVAVVPLTLSENHCHRTKRQAGRSGLGFYQIISFALCAYGHETLYMPFKNEVLFPMILWGSCS